MSWSWQLLLFASLLAAPGCAAMRAVGVLQEPETDLKNHHAAKTAWRRHAHLYKNGVVPHCDDFARGWKAGYFDVASGREGCTPLLPPSRYRGPRYQTPVGHAKAQAWFDGFEEGAGVAHDEGIGVFAYAPTRRPMPQPRTVPTSLRPRPASESAEQESVEPEILEPILIPAPSSNESDVVDPRANPDDMEPEESAPRAQEPEAVEHPTESPEPAIDAGEEAPGEAAEPGVGEDLDSPLLDEETDSALDGVLEEFGFPSAESEPAPVEAEPFQGDATPSPTEGSLFPEPTDPGEVPSLPTESEVFEPTAEPTPDPTFPVEEPQPQEAPQSPAEDDFNIEDLFGANHRQPASREGRPAPFLGNPGRLVGMRMAESTHETRPAAAEVTPQSYTPPLRNPESAPQMAFAAPAKQESTPKSPQRLESAPVRVRSAAPAATLEALGDSVKTDPTPHAGSEVHRHESGSSRPGAIDSEAKEGRDDRNRTLAALGWIEA